MINIVTWHAPSNNGAFQKQSELGIFSDMLTVKPTFSFPFTSMQYVEQANIFEVDGQPMTDEQKAECLSFINNRAIPFEWYKQVKFGQLSGTYQNAIRTIAGVVDSAEMTSWAKQEAEARAYLADNTVATPILSVLVVSRNQGETILQLAEKIVLKADQYATAYASVLGIYQDKQKQLEAATTVAEVLAIN